MTIDEQLRPILSACVRDGLGLKEIMTAIETKVIDIAIGFANGNKSAAAKALGVHRNTILSKRRAQRHGEIVERRDGYRMTARYASKMADSLTEQIRRERTRR